MAEVWKETPVPGYEVSSRGSVRSYYRRGHSRQFETPVLLKPVIGNHGYPVVNLKGKVFCIHELVCTAFHGKRPKGCEVGHGDGTRTNNHFKNLRWVTRSENVLDSIEHGTWQVRKSHPRWGEGYFR